MPERGAASQSKFGTGRSAVQIGRLHAETPCYDVESALGLSRQADDDVHQTGTERRSGVQEDVPVYAHDADCRARESASNHRRTVGGDAGSARSRDDQGSKAARVSEPFGRKPCQLGAAAAEACGHERLRGIGIG